MFLLTGGQVADCSAAKLLLEKLPECRMLHADKAYDSDALRTQIEEQGAVPNIPPKANLKWKNCVSPTLYKDRNAIERMFCRIKDFSRIANRYDRSAKKFSFRAQSSRGHLLLVMSLDPSALKIQVF